METLSWWWRQKKGQRVTKLIMIHPLRSTNIDSKLHKSLSSGRWDMLSDGRTGLFIFCFWLFIWAFTVVMETLWRRSSWNKRSDSPAARPTCRGVAGRWTHTADRRRWCRKWRRPVDPAHTPHHWRNYSWALPAALNAPVEGRWRSPGDTWTGRSINSIIRKGFMLSLTGD